jgi:uncharacterized membrane protein YuzA (DUF378 family)
MEEIIIDGAALLLLIVCAIPYLLIGIVIADYYGDGGGFDEIIIACIWPIYLIKKFIEFIIDSFSKPEVMDWPPNFPL